MTNLTPYAVLLVKPTDTDEVIRKAYHALARTAHPDITVGQAIFWERYNSAYAAIETVEEREAWKKERSMLSGLCGACEASGVVGTRLFGGEIEVCAGCGGRGRV